MAKLIKPTPTLTSVDARRFVDNMHRNKNAIQTPEETERRKATYEKYGSIFNL